MISVSTTVEKIISGKKIIENNDGKSGDRVYKIDNLKHNKIFAASYFYNRLKGTPHDVPLVRHT